MFLTNVVVGSVLAAISTASISTLAVEHSKGLARNSLRNKAEIAFRIIQARLDKDPSDFRTEVNDCTVTDWGTWSDFSRPVTMECATESGRIKVTPTRRIVCQECVDNSLIEAAADQETTDPAQQQMEEFFS